MVLGSTYLLPSICIASSAICVAASAVYNITPAQSCNKVQVIMLYKSCVVQCKCISKSLIMLQAQVLMCYKLTSYCGIMRHFATPLCNYSCVIYDFA